MLLSYFLNKLVECHGRVHMTDLLLGFDIAGGKYIHKHRLPIYSMRSNIVTVHSNENCILCVISSFNQ